MSGSKCSRLAGPEGSVGKSTRLNMASSYVVASTVANQPRVRLQTAQTESITGTSTSTPTTVARAAPDSGPNRAIAVATASSKKLLAPISAPGAATA